MIEGIQEVTSMIFATKHHKNSHLEQLSRTSWPDDPDNVILKTSCAKFVFQGQVRKHYVYSGFLQFDSLENMRFWSKSVCVTETDDFRNGRGQKLSERPFW